MSASDDQKPFKEKSGETLVKEVVDATGLPSDWVEGELTAILDSSGHDAEKLTLEELRASLAAWLETLKDTLIQEEILSEDSKLH